MDWHDTIEQDIFILPNSMSDIKPAGTYLRLKMEEVANHARSSQALASVGQNYNTDTALPAKLSASYRCTASCLEAQRKMSSTVSALYDLRGRN